MNIITEEIYNELVSVRDKLKPYVISRLEFTDIISDKTKTELVEVNIMEEQLSDMIDYIEKNQTWNSGENDGSVDEDTLKERQYR